MATTTPNYGWTVPTSTDLVKDGATAIETLGDAVDATVFANANAAINKTIVDAKGDLIAATAADTVARLAVGSNNQVLIADSTTATGLKWGTPASGSMTLLSTTSLTGASVTVSSISQSYKNLYIEWEGVTQSADGTFDIQLNATNGAHFSNVFYSAATTNTAYTDNVIKLLNNQDTGSTNANNAGSITVFNYSSTTARKTFNHQSIFVRLTSAVASVFGGGAFNSTSAVSSLKFNNTTGNDFNAGTLRIYGVN